MRKNILRTFIAAVATASFLVVPAYAESAVVAGNGVNFRAGPGMNYYVIATLDKGDARHGDRPLKRRMVRRILRRL